MDWLLWNFFTKQNKKLSSKMNIVKSLTSPTKKKSLYSSQKQLIDEDEEINLDSLDEDIRSFHDEKDNVDTVIFTNEKATVNKINVDVHAISEKSSISDNKSETKQHISEKTSPKVSIDFPTTLANAFRKQLSKEKSESKETLLNNENIEQIELTTLTKQKKIEIVTDESSEKTSKESEVLNTELKKQRKEKKVIKTDDSIKDNTNSNVKNTSQLTIIGVYVHECSKYVKSGFLNTPIVKIYVFDINSGKQMKTESTTQIITKPYSICLHGTMSPQWNELVLFENEFINLLLKINEYLILFEVIDKNESTDTEFNSLALAFIIPFCDKNLTNINTKLKLQLYECPSVENKLNPITIFQWWKSKDWIKKPAYLKITLKAIFKNENLQNINKIKSALIENTLKLTASKKSTQKLYANHQYSLLERPKSAHCKIPNRLTKCIDNSERGSTLIKFSCCGKYLACSSLIEKKHIIIIYKIPDLDELAKLTGHTNLIYDMCWLNYLASASADCSVCLWKVNETSHIMVQKIMHSSFIYTVKVCPHNQNILATGGYDKSVRIWLNDEEKANNVDFKLHQELDGHDGFINTICFVSNSDTFYTGDSNGLIIKWNSDEGTWYNVQKIAVKEFKNNIINDIQIFPNGRRLLVLLRHSISWNLDLMTQTAFMCYKDNDSCRYLTRGKISPCTTMIFIRNKVFDSATGKILAVYDPPAFDNNPIISVDYNSIYHLIAISSYAKNVPLLICHYEENSENDLELGLDMFASMPSKIKLNVPLQLKPIKKSPERSQSKIRHHSRDNSEANSLRLWDLIVKMDSILKNAKQGKTRLEIKNLNGKLPTSNGNMYKVQNKVENQNSKLKNATDTDTYSIDLTNFHQVMNERDISKENSEQEGTYNVKKDKFVSPTEDENNSPKDAAFEDSSTLSQAESLEDDCQTYSIHLEK